MDLLAAEGEQLNFSNRRAANCAAYAGRLKQCVERGVVDPDVLAACVKDP